MQMSTFDDIAIVGISCRFPGARDSNEFWKNMVNGIDSVGASIEWQNLDPSIITNHFASIENKDKFDNDFFNISPREAIHMDPQQRLLLEETWHCIEDSGIPLRNLQEKCTSVFVGALSIESYSDYWSGDEMDNYTGSGNYPFMLANRISYFWGFNGISKVIDTACSSSFMALYDAYISLLNGSSDYAIVSGIHIHHGPFKYSIWSKNRMLTHGGKCRTFDKDASGIVAGEGVGVILLQPLQKAIAEKNNIYGILKSCAINHGGKGVSISSPRVISQRNVIISAIEEAKISPETISYVETHGTGTSLGDPIEIEALKQAYQKYTKKRNFCKIGSVKTNIGHLMSAAGMTSLIKVLLMLKYKKIPPLLNYTEINPIIDINDSPFVIATKCEDWENVAPLRAGISCFGYGGVNGHIILEEYCDSASYETDLKKEMFFPLLLSAQSLDSLKSVIEKWKAELSSESSFFSKSSLRDICLTQLFSRASFNVRCGRWVSSQKELLDYINSNKEYTSNRKKVLPPLLFCAGNIDLKGYAEIRLFFESSFFFQNILNREFDKLKDKVQWEFKMEFLKEEWDKKYIEIFRFFSSYILAIIIIELGLKFNIFTAFGNGVWMALVICGVLEIDKVINYLLGKDKLKNIDISYSKYTFYDPVNRREYKKNKISNEYISILLSKAQVSPSDFAVFLEKFRLLAKNQFTYRKFIEEWKDYLPILKIEEILKDEAFIENNNADSEFMLFVLILTSSLYKLNQKWGFSNKLDLKNEYFDELVSLVVDGVITKETIINLLQHRRNDIIIDNFHDLEKYEYLTEYNKTHFKVDGVDVSWIDDVHSLEKIVFSFKNEEQVLFIGKGAFSPIEQNTFYSIDYSIMSLRNGLLNLWIMGYEVKWEKWFGGSYNKVTLPLYSFNHKSFLLPRYKLGYKMNIPYIHPLIQQNISSFYGVKFRSFFYGNEFFLREHIINNKMILPATAYIEIVYKLADLVWQRQNDDILELKNVFLPSPFIVSNHSQKEILIDVINNKSLVDFKIYSINNNEINIHCQGAFTTFSKTEIKKYNLHLLLEDCKIHYISHDECYEYYRNKGINYGDGFQGVYSIHVGSGKAIAEIHPPQSQDTIKDVFSFNPAVLDAALQASIALIEDKQYVFLPFSIKRCLIFKPLSTILWSYVELKSSVNNDVIVFEIKILDEDGHLCILFDEISLKKKTIIVEKNVLALQPYWKIVEFDKKLVGSDGYTIVLCGFGDNISISLKNECIIFNSPYNDLGKYILDLSISLLHYYQKNISGNDCKNIKYRILFNREKEYLLSLYGFFKSLSLEYPCFEFQLIGTTINSFVKRKVEFLPFINYSILMEDSEGRFLYQTWKKAGIDFSETTPWKDNGVYIITGGLGGIGIILAQDILQKAKRAKIILLGRSPLSEDSEKKISQLVAYGGTVEYHSVDIASFEALNVCLENVRRKYFHINGILHCAGVIRDCFFKYKKEIDFEEVLRPKVQGTLYLDRITQSWELDFFVCFSSIAATLGNVGQIDYAMANSFMDSYMLFRGKLERLGQRKGKSISVNWPLWENGGMQISSQYIQRLEERLGIYLMENKVGLSFLHMALQKNYSQLMVLQGDKNKMEMKIGDLDIKNINNMNKTKTIKHTNEYFTLKNLVNIFSKLLRIDPCEIDETLAFDEYGCDSIVYTEFANELNQKYKLDLTPTIFFEYRTLETLFDYLTKHIVECSMELQEKIEYVKPCLEDDELPKTNIFSNIETGNNSVIEDNRKTNNDDIAIIGMTGRFPMADDLDIFWENLVEERNCVVETPSERLKIYKKYTNCQTEDLIKWGGFISDIDKFDPLFFGISSREAENMDPQQRLLLMYAWKTLEDAGYSTSQIKGSNMGIIMAIVNSGYDIFRVCSKSPIDGYSYADVVPSMSANRISYFLDIHGPSETVETACSSSLVAIHRAIKVINNGECEMVLTGGINLLLNPELYISFDKAGMLAHDGKCKTFSNNANGYVRGEGIGMLLLKRKEKAIEDRDHIYGIIRASCENHGGRANTLTSPNLKAQTDLLVTTYENAQIDPRTISYIEAHGTGTKLGDPIEVDALKAAFKTLIEKRDDKQHLDFSCGLGSVKTNIGHLEIAAGMSGIIKILLQMKHETIVKSLHCDIKNPYIQLDSTPFYITDKTKKWNRLKDINGHLVPLRAGISSFGFGGVNAHLVLEEYICDKKVPPKILPSLYIILLSAKTKTALINRAILLMEYMEKKKGTISLYDMAYTLQLGRDQMPFRLAMLVDNEDDLIYKLHLYINKKTDNVNGIFIGDNCSENLLMKYFSNDEILLIIKQWIKNEKYENILRLWSDGVVVDWNLLYNDHPYRLSLPSYPFDVSSYWADSVNENTEDNCESIIDSVLMGDIDIDSASNIIERLNDRQ